jgi:phosphohistidine phosphatase
MSRFFLVRHAKAEPKHPNGDAARRITRDGRTRFAAHVRALAADLAVSRIVASPFARARDTAHLLAAATGAEVEESSALASGTSSGRDVLRLGERLGAGIALVGHNPEIAEAVALAAGRDLDVPPGTVAAVDVDANDAGFRLAWLRAPG